MKPAEFQSAAWLCRIVERGSDLERVHGYRTWSSTVFAIPPCAVVTKTRKVAILKLPRGYDPTRLFKPEVRSSIQAHEQALRLRDMELGLSSPDIVGIRIPDSEPLRNLGEESRSLIVTKSAPPCSVAKNNLLKEI